MMDIADLEPHRSALMGHCYRMLGSAFDAEDAVQETMVRAWQNLERFEGRASVRTWLYRIATNVCLDMLSARSRRARPVEDGPISGLEDPLEPRPRSHWLEPIPDARALPSDANPHEIAVLRQSIRLAFVAALQHLPPRQRAALLLSDVLGWPAAEAAESLGLSVAAVNSALQRARATLASRQATRNEDGRLSGEDALSDADAVLLDRYVEAFHRFDVDTLVSLLREEATLSMPPFTFWIRGVESIRTWLLGRGSDCRGSRLVPIQASGTTAFAQYRPDASGGGFHAWAVIILEPADGRIASWNTFLDTEALFPFFGLPARLSS